MDGLLAAATVTAIVEISAKIASLCFVYSVAVTHAKKDIDRLQRSVTDNLGVMEEVKQLFDRHDKTRLPTTHKLLSSLEECHQQLQGLKTAGAWEDSKCDEPFWSASFKVALHEQAGGGDSLFARRSACSVSI